MFICGETIAKVWEKSINEIINHYSYCKNFVPTERGIHAIELLNVVLEIKKPLSKKRVSDYYSNKDYIKKYSKYLLNQNHQNQVYSRISKLANKDLKINQKIEIVEKLKKVWYSRRCVISIWLPLEDLHSNHPPCICLLQFFLRQNNLFLTSFFRSNDAWLHAPVDILALTNLQKEIADNLSVGVGTYTHFAVSYHIYDFDLPAVLKTFKV